MTNWTSWDIIRNGRVIDTVFYHSEMTQHEVRQSLIDHDGYSADIIVRPATR